MATVATRSDSFTYEDFCALVPGKQKGDLIDGVIYVASAENIEAHKLFRWLYTLMHLFTQRQKLGEIYGSRVACRLDDQNAPEPDILFVSQKHLERVKRGGVIGAPDLAMEIVSPESVERDYEKKRKQYQRFGITEYWIIDEEEKLVTLLRLDSKGKYHEVKPRKGVLQSKVMTGFRLDPTWLWQRPLPDGLETLQLLLASND